MTGVAGVVCGAMLAEGRVPGAGIAVKLLVCVGEREWCPRVWFVQMSRTSGSGGGGDGGSC